MKQSLKMTFPDMFAAGITMTSVGLKALVIVTLFGSILAQNKTTELKDPLFHENSLIHLLSNITEDHLTTLDNATKPQPDSTGKLFAAAVDDAVTHSPVTVPGPTVNLENDSTTKVQTEAKVGLQGPVKIDVQSTTTPPAPVNDSGVVKPEVSSSHVASGADLPPHVLVCLHFYLFHLTDFEEPFLTRAKLGIDFLKLGAGRKA